ncbi:MAG TPA: hypothetical protein VMT94_00160 [Burkholderiales bacterium]|nr:hypothetical protein [Burkholderiales bacterium]
MIETGCNSNPDDQIRIFRDAVTEYILERRRLVIADRQQAAAHPDAVVLFPLDNPNTPIFGD